LRSPPLAIVWGYSTAGWQAGEIVRDRQTWRLDAGTPAGSYDVTVRLLDPQTGESSPEERLGRIEVAGRPHVFEPPVEMQNVSDAVFGNVARLLGFDYTLAGSELAVTLYWQALGATEVPFSVSVQLLNASGVLRAQRDQQPGDRAFPTTGWVTGEMLTDAYRITLPPDLPAGTYTVIVKLYETDSGGLAPVFGPDGEPRGDFARLAEVELP
jgi:hypothetical protein